MSDKNTAKTENRSFLQIKKELDSSKGYLIFENDINQSDESLFSETLQIYHYLEKNQMIWQKILDSGLEREFLIIQTEPGNEDIILGRLLAGPLPRDMVYYIYKARRP